MNLKKTTLTVCVISALFSLHGSAHAATELPKKFTYKKYTENLRITQSPTNSQNPAIATWELSTNSLIFGELTQGQENTLSVGFQNTGLVEISMPSISTTGIGFSSTHNCNSVAIGGICAISVTAQGQSLGANLTGTLMVSVGAVNKSVTLNGSSAYYDFSLTPQVADLGVAYINGNILKQLTLTNIGNKPLTIPSLISSDPRVVLTHSCGILAPQQACTINVSATSSTATTIHATSTLTSANVSKALTFDANFVLPSATLLPQSNSSFNFGLQDINQPNTQYYSFTNTGSLGLSNLVVTAPANTTIVGNDCGATLNAGSSCNFGVKWQPSTYSALSGELSVTSSELAQTAILQGVVKQSVASLQSGSLILGNVAQYSSSTTTLTFQNTGTTSMTLTGLSGLPASMAMSNNTCSNIASNSTCTMLITLNTYSTASQSSIAVTPVGASISNSFNVSYNVVATQQASCATIKSGNASLTSGTYTIDPDGAGGAAPVSVYCDMTTDGGGWTRVSDIDEALKAGALSTVSISDLGLSYTQVMMVAKSNMMTKYENEFVRWWNTGINPAIHGLKFGTSWYFLAYPTAWRGFGSSNTSPFGVTLSGGVGWPNSNYTTVVANPGGSYCNLDTVAQTICGKAVKVNVPTGLKLSGFNDIESLQNNASNNQSVRALEIYVR